MTEVWFVGVKTAGSLIHRAISLWRELLPAPYEVRGVDVEPGSPGARNVELLEELRTAPGRVAGAVVSVHKVGLRRSQEWPLVGNPPRAAIPRPQYPSANFASSDIISGDQGGSKTIFGWTFSTPSSSPTNSRICSVTWGPIGQAGVVRLKVT